MWAESDGSDPLNLKPAFMEMESRVSLESWRDIVHPRFSESACAIQKAWSRAKIKNDIQPQERHSCLVGRELESILPRVATRMRRASLKTIRRPISKDKEARSRLVRFLEPIFSASTPSHGQAALSRHFHFLQYCPSLLFYKIFPLLHN